MDGRTGTTGSDKGIDGLDGIEAFVDDNSGKAKQVIVPVKSGHVKSGDIRDLLRSHPATGDKVSEMLQAFRSFIGENQMMAYLVTIAVCLCLH